MIILSVKWFIGVLTSMQINTPNTFFIFFLNRLKDKNKNIIYL